jgi:hypothetical protein
MEDYNSKWNLIKRNYTSKCFGRPFVNKEFTIPTISCDYSLQQKGILGKDENQFMNLDKECILTDIPWMKDNKFDDLL